MAWQMSGSTVLPGSMTITLSATPVCRSASFMSSRSSAALPPITVRISRSKARNVSGPKVPSGRPGSKPSSVSRRCSVVTSSPTIMWPGTKDSTRSPSCHLASSRRRKVSGPTMPSTVMPRSCWNARTARSSSSSKGSESRSVLAGTSAHNPRCASRARTSATAAPLAPRRSTWLKVFGQVGEQRGLRLRADDRLDDLATGVDVHRGDGRDAVGRGRLRVLIDVELRDDDAVVLGGDLLENGGDHLARAAPFGPEIHDDRLVAHQDIVGERCIAHDLRCAHGYSLVCVRWCFDGVVGWLSLRFLTVLVCEETLGVQGSGAPGARGRDRLPVNVIDEVATSENTGLVSAC